MFQIYLACSVYRWSSVFSNNLLEHCTCTTIILAYKIMCSQELYVPGIHVADWKQVWWFNYSVLGTFHPIAWIMVNPRYRNFTIHKIQIPYDVIYAYNLLIIQSFKTFFVDVNVQLYHYQWNLEELIFPISTHVVTIICISTWKMVHISYIKS